MRALTGSLSVALVGCGLSLAAPSEAACNGASPTWSSTPDFASLSACVTGASSGDTINVSAGSATWDAGSHVEISQSLTLAGAGADATTIVDNTPQGNSPFTVTLSGTDSVRISGIHFQRLPQNPSNYNPIVEFSTSGTTFSRIHDCLFEDIDERTIGAGSSYLLIDSNVFTCVSAWCAPIIVSGDQSGNHPMDYGGSSFVFVENNTFDFSAVTDGERDGALDCKDKGRFVFRYNTLLGTRVMNHGFDSTVSCMSFEIYANGFTDDGPDFQNGFFVQLRGGTGLIHDNVMGGSTQLWGAPLGATNYRSCSGNAQISASKACDGTVYGVCSDEAFGEWADCTSDPDCAALSSGTCTRKWCSVSRDILCTSTSDCPGGEACTGATDGSGPNGYPCRDQIGRGTNQETDPLYLWNNVAYGASVGLAILDNGDGTCFTAEHIQADRDYCEHAPATSCGSVPGWSYAPFACPHPAAGLTGGCDPTIAGTPGYDIHDGGHGGSDAGVGGNAQVADEGSSSGGGCGCRTARGASSGWLPSVLLALALRRRRPHRRQPAIASRGTTRAMW
jgi:MYXO-CTERM domain-containing protein